MSNNMMQKKAEGDSMVGGFADLGKAITYIVMGGAAAIGAGAGVLADKITEPTDTDFANARKAYSVADLRAAIMSNNAKLKNERKKDKPKRKSMWGIV